MVNYRCIKFIVSIPWEAWRILHIHIWKLQWSGANWKLDQIYIYFGMWYDAKPWKFCRTIYGFSRNDLLIMKSDNLMLHKFYSKKIQIQIQECSLRKLTNQVDCLVHAIPKNFFYWPSHPVLLKTVLKLLSLWKGLETTFFVNGWKIARNLVLR